MEADPDDMFVVIVGDGDEAVDIPAPINSLQVDTILNTAVELGEFVEINCKTEPPDDFECKSIEHIESFDVKVEVKSEQEDSDDYYDEEYLLEKQTSYKKTTNYIKQKPNHDRRLLKPSEYKPYVSEIRKLYPELNEDRELLIDTIAEMMRNVKVPEPPEDFCKEDGVCICKYCGAANPTLTAAARHYQEKHGPRYIVCYACGADFRSAANLFRHEFRCRAPDARIVQQARVRSMGDKTRSTPFVRFYVRQKSNITRFPCTECSAVFSSKSSLISHENLHKGQRPYQCSQCPNAYTSQYAFHRHMKNHSNVEYICDYCGKSFKIKALIVSHIHTHEKIKKFVCEYCKRRFRQKGALNHHVNTVHKNLPPPCACQICGKRYPRMSLLKVHMNKVHGLIIMTREMFVKALPTMTEIQVQQAARIVLKSEVQQTKYTQPNGDDSCAT